MAYTFDQLIKLPSSELAKIAAKGQKQVAQQRINLRKRYGYEALWKNNVSLKGIKDIKNEYYRRTAYVKQIMRVEQIKSTMTYTAKGYLRHMTETGDRLGLKFVKPHKTKTGRLMQGYFKYFDPNTNKWKRSMTSAQMSKLLKAFNRVREGLEVSYHNLTDVINMVVGEWYRDEGWREYLDNPDMLEALIQDKIQDYYDKLDETKSNQYGWTTGFERWE